MYPYKAGSESCSALAKALGVRRIKHDNSTFKGKQERTVINWGATKVPDGVNKCVVVNHPERVAIACNKLETYRVAEEEGLCPAHTTNKIVAKDWLNNYDIVERHTLTGMGGDGIRIVEKGDFDSLSDEAKVYCLYVPKKAEFRVHVIGGKVVDVQRKSRRRDVPDDQVNWKVRNHANGFIYARGEDLGVVPDQVRSVALRTVELIGLDFGAVDVIYNESKDIAYVLEVNTAPGLSGETVDIYKRGFEELLNIGE